MKATLKRIALVAALSVGGMIAYGTADSYLLPRLTGYKNEANVGNLAIRMAPGWYAQVADSHSVTFVKSGLFAKLSPGYLDFWVLQNPTPEFLVKINKNSVPYSTYKWGTVLRLKPTFYSDVMKVSHKGGVVDFFVPGMNAWISVLRPENIDNIKDIVRSPTPPDNLKARF